MADAVGVPLENAELARARVVAGCLHQAVRTLQLYPPASPVPGESTKQLFDELTSFLRERGALALRVEGGEFLYGGQRLRADVVVEDALAAAFSRDGIRTLSFLPGLRFDELELFLGIVAKGLSARGNDDFATLMWEAPLDRISYKTVSRDAREYPLALPCGFRTRGAQAPGESPDYPALIQRESVGRPGAGTAASDVARLHADLARLAGDESLAEGYRREASSFDSAGALIAVLLDILSSEEEAAGFGEACLLVDEAYDRFISSADFASARRLGEGLAALEKSPAPRKPDCAALLKEARLRASGRKRIALLCEALNAHPDGDLDACRRLLASLPGGIIPRLFEALASLENYPARMMVCDILVELGAEKIEAVADGLLDGRWFVARNAAMALGRIGGAGALPFLERAAKHRHEAVRGEALAALARIDGAEASRLLRGLLDDASRDLRLRALAELLRRRDAFTGLILEEKVQDAGFVRVDGDEQQLCLSALARIRGDAALPTFQGLIDRWIVFNRSAAGRLRLRAIAALAEDDGARTAAYIEDLARQRNHWVREAAEYVAVKIHSRGRRD